MLFIGYDLGSSSVKASLLDAENGNCIASAYYPKYEMEINSPKAGWAEQDPDTWWENLKLATREILENNDIDKNSIKGIGVSYQMHGLVMVDKDFQVIRPSIIWCDSRAVEIGNKAFNEIGGDKCLSCLLNSPGNFTASKLKWVKENEPELFEKIHKIMLPGDYIGYRLTGEAVTTVSGLSEGIMWDFSTNDLAGFLLDYYGIPASMLPDIVPLFSIQGKLAGKASSELNLPEGIPVGYRAGDQPNNAFSLNVLNPGEIAATAGTSGVVYGISDEVKYDPESRVNTFAHVNHDENNKRLGVLLCINGTGIQYSWIKKNFTYSDIDYDEMNELASSIPPGSEGVLVLPFGNGAERVLKNKDTGGMIKNLNFNRHSTAHIIRATQEGIVFSFKYGMDIMQQTGISPKIIRAGNANMFLSPIFKNSLSTLTGATIELYDTDGSLGAARGAAIGTGYYKDLKEAFSTLKKIETIGPDKTKLQVLKDTYGNWVETLNKNL